MHRWIRHPLGAVTVLAPPGQDPAQRPRGAGGASAFPRCRDLHGAPCQLSERDCFPSQLLRASKVPPAPLLLVPLVPARGHLRTQVSPCIRGCKNGTERFSPGLCLLEERVALQLVQEPGFGVPLLQLVTRSVALSARTPWPGGPMARRSLLQGGCVRRAGQPQASRRPVCPRKARCTIPLFARRV